MKRSMALILGAAAVATLTGCPFGASYTGPTACALLTAPLAQSVIGAQAKQTSSEKLSDYVTTCEYRNGLNTVSVEAGSWGWYSHTAKGPAVAGIGDEAYMSPSGLLVRKGGNGILVNLTVTGDFREPVAKSAAREDKLKKELASKLVANI
ncbi:MAG TPA: hypothetical protein VFO29_10170 [Candidatus Rubrimentiphilum sp.]|nr:hypothetical protein [Candidatus Rubrimentiphilum sp.]